MERKVLTFASRPEKEGIPRESLKLQNPFNSWNSRGRIGGGGQSRTVDAADMSRVDTKPNLLELLTELLLEASVGDNQDP